MSLELIANNRELENSLKMLVEKIETRWKTGCQLRYIFRLLSTSPDKSVKERIEWYSALEEAERSRLGHSFWCFDWDCDSWDACLVGLVLLVSADFPGMIRYFIMSSVPFPFFLILSAFTPLILLDLTSTGLACFALKWNMGSMGV